MLPHRFDVNAETIKQVNYKTVPGPSPAEGKVKTVWSVESLYPSRGRQLVDQNMLCMLYLQFYEIVDMFIKAVDMLLTIKAVLQYKE